MASTASFYSIINDVYSSGSHALKMVISLVHTHASASSGGQLDWDNVWSDAVHTHGTDTEGGQLDHGLVFTAASLLDDDHPQYVQESILTAQGDIPYASGSATWTRLGIGTANQLLSVNAAGTGFTWSSVGLTGTVVRKGTNESVTNSTAFQPDDELKFSVAANEIWGYTCYIIGSSNGIADLRVGFTTPSGGSYRAVGVASEDAGTTRSCTGTTFMTFTTSTGTQLVVVNGLFYNGTTAGSLTMQWTAGSITGSPTSVLANSSIVATRIL